MPPKAPQNPKWLQKIGERVDEYGDVLQAHTQCPEGELAAPDTGYAATMRKEAFKRQLQAVQEGRRVPWMEWPQKPSEEMHAMRLGFTRAATFASSRHAMIVCGRPAVVLLVI